MESVEDAETEYTFRFIFFIYFFRDGLWNPCRRTLKRILESVLAFFCWFFVKSVFVKSVLAPFI